MSIPSETETTTIKLIISLEHKKTLEKAAGQRNMSLNEYLLEIAVEAAEKVSLSMTPEEIVLSERDWDIFVSALENPPESSEALSMTPEEIVLSEHDWDIFVSALENPPEPSEALKAAIKEYQEEYGKW